MRVGTKAKRAQSVVIRKSEDYDIFILLKFLVSVTPVGSPLFPFSLTTYNKRLKAVEKRLGTNFGWTPHSPRAGFASEAIALGRAFADTRDIGRWLSDSSLRIYIDIVQTSDIASQLQAKGYTPALHWACSDQWWSFFSAEWLKPSYWKL